jgi:hypothetical protein
MSARTSGRYGHTVDWYKMLFTRTGAVKQKGHFSMWGDLVE